MPSSFDYAVIRIVPFTEREEFFNVGVILFCPQQRFLASRTYLDIQKLKALAPGLWPADVTTRLEAISKIASGDPHNGGPIAQLAQSARFHWLTAPRSTLVQVSPVHSGLCDSPNSALERLFAEQVLPRNTSVTTPPGE